MMGHLIMSPVCASCTISLHHESRWWHSRDRVRQLLMISGLVTGPNLLDAVSVKIRAKVRVKVRAKVRAKARAKVRISARARVRTEF